MNCDKCKSARVAEIRSRCKDQFHAKMGSIESEGYVDRRWGVRGGGGGDDIDFHLCMEVE